MILIPLLIFIITIVLYATNRKLEALLFIIVTKSIIDAFWDIRLGPISPIRFQGIMICLMFLPIVNTKTFSFSWKINSIILFLSYSISILFSANVSPLQFIESLFLSLIVALSFFLIPQYINNTKKLKKLLIAIIICGVFPSVITILQYALGIESLTGTVRATTGDLVRNIGFYHDAFPTRFYALLTIFSGFFFLIYFKTEKKYIRNLVALQILLSIFSLYLVFSKAAVLIILIWVLLILVFLKLSFKLYFYLLSLVIILLISFGTESILINVETLFSKELGFNDGSVRDARYTLSGRGYIWENSLNEWRYDRSIFFQFFGDGLSQPVHNEFLRVFLMNGVIGISLFISFLIIIINKIFKLNRIDKLLALMLISMFLVDCTGLVPGEYYYYNIILWGFLGILFRVCHQKKQINIYSEKILG